MLPQMAIAAIADLNWCAVKYAAIGFMQQTSGTLYAAQDAEPENIGNVNRRYDSTCEYY